LIEIKTSENGYEMARLTPSETAFRRQSAGQQMTRPSGCAQHGCASARWRWITARGRTYRPTAFGRSSNDARSPIGDL